MSPVGRSHSAPTLSRVVALVMLVGAAHAQLQWVERSANPHVRTGTRMVFDGARGATVLFGGRDFDGFMLDDTWQWNGRLWTRVHTTNAPSPRYQHAMVHDASRALIVLFGGRDRSSVANAETWEWDGSDWTQRFPANSPPPRSNHELVYDATRQVVVLFGGADQSQAPVGDTWEWNGIDWMQRGTAPAPAPAPAPRMNHAMTWDPRKQVVLLHGGMPDFSQNLDDTWEWDGTRWQRLSPISTPGGRRGHRMAFDAALDRTVLFGGYTWPSPGTRRDMWEWDGASWRPLSPTVTPPATADFTMTWDPGHRRLVLFSTPWTWEWDGSRWTNRSPEEPAGVGWPGLAFDSWRGVTVLFGGRLGGITNSGNTWEWDGAAWTQRFPPVAPPELTQPAMTFDARRGRTVLFGGVNGSTSRTETWEWDGTSWRQRSSVNHPPPIRLPEMAFDESRGVCVLFGGIGRLVGPWEWDGNDWVDRSATAGPTGGYWNSFVYDPARETCVAVGGGNGRGLQIWKWDGSIWQNAPSVGAPLFRYYFGMAQDAARDRTVIYSGANAAREDTWEWDGTTWVQRTVVGDSPAGRHAHRMVFDSWRHRIVLFGGLKPAGFCRDTWELAPVFPAASETFGTGCATGGGTAPALRPTGPPWLGDAFGMSLLSVPRAAQPVLLLGASSREFAGVALPLALAAYGLPGCTLYTSLDITVPLGTTSASANIQIPDAPALRGSSFYCQLLVAPPTGGSASFSNAVAAVIGAR